MANSYTIKIPLVWSPQFKPKLCVEIISDFWFYVTFLQLSCIIIFTNNNNNNEDWMPKSGSPKINLLLGQSSLFFNLYNVQKKMMAYSTMVAVKKKSKVCKLFIWLKFASIMHVWSVKKHTLKWHRYLVI